MPGHLCRQSVLAVARDLGVEDCLSAVDVSILEELTGGRRAELLNVLGRVKQTSSGGTSVQRVGKREFHDKASWIFVSTSLHHVSCFSLFACTRRVTNKEEVELTVLRLEEGAGRDELG